MRPRAKSASAESLSTTAYGILGLLALREWTTYELAKQMERGLGLFWSPATSMVYEEPKKLVALGLAKARKAFTGRRPRTVYSITAKGRRELSGWLGQPGAGPDLEFQGLVKVLFGEFGTREQLIENFAEAARRADGILAIGRTVAEENLRERRRSRSAPTSTRWCSRTSGTWPR